MVTEAEISKLIRLANGSGLSDSQIIGFAPHVKLYAKATRQSIEAGFLDILKALIPS